LTGADQRVVVIGVGNDLRGDDAAGLEVARSIEPIAGARVVMHDGEAVDLLDHWQGADAVVIVDTIRSGAPAGTIHRIDASAEAIPSPLRRASSHTIGVAEAIELGRTLGELPGRVIVYGVEGVRFEAGSEMTDEVRAAVAKLGAAVGAEARTLAGAA
jgi:hydrogenase maturation protease